MVRRIHQLLESADIVGPQERLQPVPDHLLLRQAEHFGQALVAVEHRAVRAERDGPFLDLLDQHPIRAISILQRIDPVRGRGVTHHDGIDLAAPDRP